MDFLTAQRILNSKEPSALYDVVEAALQDADIRRLLVDHTFDKNETVRYNSVRVLFRALALEPALFYQYWDRFGGMIDCPNGFHRSAASQAIAFLSEVDTDCRLDRLLRKYLALMNDDKVMVTHYFLDTLDRVYRARPEFRKRVIGVVLGLDESTHTPAHKDLLRADVLVVLDRLFDVLPRADQKRATAFASAALSSQSPKARKAARLFIAQHPT
jgi:hypothetical protein